MRKWSFRLDRVRWEVFDASLPEFGEEETVCPEFKYLGTFRIISSYWSCRYLEEFYWRPESSIIFIERSGAPFRKENHDSFHFRWKVDVCSKGEHFWTDECCPSFGSAQSLQCHLLRAGSSKHLSPSLINTRDAKASMDISGPVLIAENLKKSIGTFQ